MSQKIMSPKSQELINKHVYKYYNKSNDTNEETYNEVIVLIEKLGANCFSILASTALDKMDSDLIDMNNLSKNTIKEPKVNYDMKILKYCLKQMSEVQIDQLHIESKHNLKKFKILLYAYVYGENDVKKLLMYQNDIKEISTKIGRLDIIFDYIDEKTYPNKEYFKYVEHIFNEVIDYIDMNDHDIKTSFNNVTNLLILCTKYNLHIDKNKIIIHQELYTRLFHILMIKMIDHPEYSEILLYMITNIPINYGEWFINFVNAKITKCYQFLLPHMSEGIIRYVLTYCTAEVKNDIDDYLIKQNYDWLHTIVCDYNLLTKYQEELKRQSNDTIRHLYWYAFAYGKMNNICVMYLMNLGSGTLGILETMINKLIEQQRYISMSEILNTIIYRYSCLHMSQSINELICEKLVYCNDLKVYYYPSIETSKTARKALDNIIARGDPDGKMTFKTSHKSTTESITTAKPTIADVMPVVPTATICLSASMPTVTATSTATAATAAKSTSLTTSTTQPDNFDAISTISHRVSQISDKIIELRNITDRQNSELTVKEIEIIRLTDENNRLMQRLLELENVDSESDEESDDEEEESDDESSTDEEKVQVPKKLDDTNKSLPVDDFVMIEKK